MNREIDEKFDDIKDSLDRIEVQTTKHNGRMSKVELRQAFWGGGLVVLTFIVVPILGWALWVLVNIQGQVQSAVRAAITSYNVSLEK